jgi:hypothetical protein
VGEWLLEKPASQVGPLLGQVAGPIASLTGDGAYDQDGVYRSVADHQPATAVIVPPRAAAEHEDDSVLVSHKADGPQRDREILPAT